uniref:Uncharacterized protein n=1 Tax=Rhizophora mucronata TaxID=61149 RepID=A0A2P2PAA4_RHIMU
MIVLSNSYWFLLLIPQTSCSTCELCSYNLPMEIQLLLSIEKICHDAYKYHIWVLLSS